MNFTINRNKQTSVLLQLQTHHQQEIKRNRKYLSVIIETLIFTAQQDIPQRNSTKDRTDLGTASDVNRGNFLELLHLRCRDLPWLSFKLNENLKKHSQWLSPEIQNEIFDIAATLVRKAICKNVADAEVFSLIIDETTDISNTEHLVLCIRYLFQGSIRESFVGFHSPQNTEGETLFLLIRRVLEELGLEISNVVGQCYDGAANMSGIHKGVASRVQEIVPRALYVHCHAHRLNLALQDTLESNVILRNALGLIQSFHNFFHSPKRETILKSFKDHEKFGKFIKLKGICPTRWTCRLEAVKSVDYQILRKRCQD